MGAVQAAVKKLKGNHSPQERSKFLREAAVMGQFKHPNVGQAGVVAEETLVRRRVRWTFHFRLKLL